MHIAIEGMDGVGKTTAARALADRLGFEFVEKPLHLLLDREGEIGNYLRCRSYINQQVNDDVLRAWFYGLGNLFLRHRYRDANVVTDRHLVSNYFWCGSPATERVFECLVGLLGSPDHTFLLHASEAEAVRRLRTRSPDDPDVRKVRLYPEARTKMEGFVRRFGMPYTLIDTTDMRPEEVVDRMVQLLPTGAPR